MPMPLPLSEMTLEEKLAAMEALWDDLSRNPETLESPAWHEDVLRERQGRLASGEASFMDWEQSQGSYPQPHFMRIEILRVSMHVAQRLKLLSGLLVDRPFAGL